MILLLLMWDIIFMVGNCIFVDLNFICNIEEGLSNFKFENIGVKYVKVWEGWWYNIFYCWVFLFLECNNCVREKFSWNIINR